jgi:hypothetical protein
MLFEPSDLTLALASDADTLPVKARVKPDDPLFGPFLERSEVVISPDYLPHAPGVQFAGPRMLKLAGCTPGMPCPLDWERAGAGVYKRVLLSSENADGYVVLQVRQSGYAKRWAVERRNPWTKDVQALVFAFGDVPIWAQSRREAMFLAEFYRKDHALQLVGCYWRTIPGLR